MSENSGFSTNVPVYQLFVSPLGRSAPSSVFGMVSFKILVYLSFLCRQPFSGKRRNSRENGCKENEGFFGMRHTERKLDISKGKELMGHDTNKKTDKTAEEEPRAPGSRIRVRR